MKKDLFWSLCGKVFLSSARTHRVPLFENNSLKNVFPLN